MLPRHQFILSQLEHVNEVSVVKLAEVCAVSVETVRRDLNFLAKANLLHRTHGGAVSYKNRDIGRSFQERRTRNSDSKKAIAEKALDYFFEEAVIALDASSSSWYFTQVMPDVPCTVITSCMNNIRSLADKPCIKTIATGGVYSHKYDAFYGAHAGYMLSRFEIDMMICSCTGISEGVVWESNEMNAVIKRKMIASAKQVFLFADESKFGRKDLIKLCELAEVDKLFTNTLPTKDIMNLCAENAVEIVI